MDQNIFFIFYNLAGRSSAGDFLIIFFGEYFFYIILLVFAFFIYKNWRGEKNNRKLYPYATAIISAIIARFAIASLIRLLYHRPRPFLALEIPHLINDNAFSFPSGHTIFMFALAMATYFFNKKLAYFLYISGAVIGLARIAGGAHYPSDVIGGAALGALAGFIIYKSWKRYFA